MTATNHPLATLWIGGDLNWLSVACLKSAVRTGHKVHLYTYGNVSNIPRGVVQLDANDVVPETDVFRFDGIAQPELFGSYGPFSDVFRWRLLGKGLGIWFDTDMYFLRQLDTSRDILMCWEGPRTQGPKQSRVGNGLLKVPAHSALVLAMMQLTMKPYAMPPWVGAGYRHKCLEKLAGRPFFPGAIAYATYGPIAVDYVVTKNGMQATVQSHELYCPVSFREVHRFGEPDAEFRASLSQDTQAVHIWNSGFGPTFAKVQPVGSFAARLREESLDA